MTNQATDLTVGIPRFFRGNGDDANPLVPTGVTSGSIIAIGVHGLLGIVGSNEKSANDACDTPIWELRKQDNLANIYPLWNGSLLVGSVWLVVPTGEGPVFPGQMVHLDTTSPPTAPVYKFNEAAPAATDALIGWTIAAQDDTESVADGGEIEVGF